MYHKFDKHFDCLMEIFSKQLHATERTVYVITSESLCPYRTIFEITNVYCVIVCVCVTPKSEWNSMLARVHNYMPRLGGE